MIDSQNVNNLAETLRKTGLVCSATEAMRMAQSIATTDSKVSRDFDNHKQQIEGTLSRRRFENKQEEIEHLINKTDFSKKDFFVPVRGYRKEAAEAVEVKTSPAEPVKNMIEEPEQPKKPISIQVYEPETKVNPEPLPTEAQEPKQEIKPVPEVYTDSFPDDVSLKDLMDESASEVYSRPTPEIKEETVPKPVIENTAVAPETVASLFSEEPASTSGIAEEGAGLDEPEEIEEYNILYMDKEEPVQVAAEPVQDIKHGSMIDEDEEFIIDIEEDPAEESILVSSQEISSAPDRAEAQEAPKPQAEAQAPAPEKKFDNPIPKVDLMQHFNFGSGR